MRLLTVGAGVSLTLFPASEPPFFLLGWLVRTQYEAFTLPYCNLFFPVCLLSLRGPLFPEEEVEGEWFWGRGEVGQS